MEVLYVEQPVLNVATVYWTVSTQGFQAVFLPERMKKINTKS